VIGSINGNILSISASSVLIETASGVGYELDIPLSDSQSLVSLKGGQVRLFTHLSIREDAHVLYGFLHLESRQCFRMLIKVSGIGPKTALALLSCLSVKEFLYSIINEDVRVLCSVPGIGKKVAERMLLELKDKVDINDFFLSENNEAQVNRISDSYEITSNDLLPSDLTTTGLYGIRNDIITALLGLGYAEKDARKVVNSLPADVTDVSIGVKQALKIITKMSL
jgi:Holliday junction DNA helicase RuvA